MSRRALVGAALAGILTAVVALLVGVWLGEHPGDLPSVLRRNLAARRQPEPVAVQAVNILTSRFYRPVNGASLVDKGLAGMVASLDDPYSRYLDPEAYRASLQDSTPHTVGIGITITPEADGLRVLGVVDGSPAAHAGLMCDDLITKVGDVSLVNAADRGPELIRGAEGTPVTITVMRGDTRRVVTLVRAKVVTPLVVRRELSYRHVRIGYVRLATFSEDSGSDVRDQVQAALHDHAQALILDLRENGGGLINEAIDVASIFIRHGTIMSAVERGRPRRVYTAKGNAIAADIPVVVLVDHGTASSSEIVTAALQDDDRAKVVGTQTYGKGTFQQTQELSNGGALDITIGQFFTPKGRNLAESAGITPNVPVPASEQACTSPDEALMIAERTVAPEVG
jgi:carboxyl-terminal processing protease